MRDIGDIQRNSLAKLCSNLGDENKLSCALIFSATITINHKFSNEACTGRGTIEEFVVFSLEWMECVFSINLLILSYCLYSRENHA